jgi:HAD superfamily hydrolase (TIGR01509 family)
VTEQPALRAVIFDMDGVLTDSEPAFYAAINDVLARNGHHVGMEQYAELIGSATPHTWSRLIEWFSLPVSLDAIIEEYEPPLQKRLREPRPALPGARELVEKLRARGVPIALCTASYMRWVEPILEGAGLTGMFDVMSTADMVEHTKPDPAPYVLAAELLGLRPEECVAIEDSANGLASALGAGCWVVQLRATETAAAVEPRARLVIHSLAEFPLDLVGEGS